MSLLAIILLASSLSGILSLIGGVVLLGKPEWVRRFSVHFVSYAAGALLAVAFLDLLPEAIEAIETIGGRTKPLLGTALIGLVAFFVIERLIHRFHVHHYEDTLTHRHATPILLMVGDAIHNFIDGVAVAAAFLVSVPLGTVTALGVAVHELPQEISDFSIMLHHGWGKKRVLWLNLAASLTNIVGAIAAYLARETIEPILPGLLAFTAGIFIYIAASDLIPELSSAIAVDKTSHVFVLLLAGIVSVWLLGKFLTG